MAKIILIWSPLGLGAIASTDVNEIGQTIKKMWTKAKIPYTEKDINDFIANRQINKRGNWFLEQAPINELYEEGTNL